MNYRVFLMVLAVSMIFTACAPGGDEPDPATQPFIGGTVGINTYLLEGIPPEVILDDGNQPFSYAVVLENLGEADIGPNTQNPFVQVKLEGINPTQWDKTDSDMVHSMDQTLRSARKNFDGTILPGELTTVTFENLRYLPNIRGNTEFVLRANVCYDYMTLSTTQICIKDDVLEHIQDATLCSLTGEKIPRNSGGPLQVTSLVQNPIADNKIQLNFVVEHVGIGQFYGRSEGENCNPSVHNFNKHNVEVTVNDLSDAGLSISCPRLGNAASGTMKLYQGAPQTVSCIIERNRESTGRIYQDILEIELKYRYGQFIETPILVQDVTN